MPCIGCGRNFHDECETNCATCHPVPEITVVELPNKIKNYKDAESTGRKRAALLYPIHPEEDCEWRGFKNNGGGKYPTVGCIMGKQEARHHCPDKDTMNNEMGNVHRICHSCHVRWHELNDPVYIQEEFKKTKHEPILANPDELVDWEFSWTSGEMSKKYNLKGHGLRIED